MKNPTDYYFCIDRNDDQMFCLTSIKYWNKYSCLDDQLTHLDCLPSHFDNAMEAMFEYSGPKGQGRKALEDAGFIYSQAMQDFVDNSM